MTTGPANTPSSVSIKYWGHVPNRTNIEKVYVVPEGARGEASLLAWQAAVGANDLHTVSWLGSVHQVVVKDDVHRTGQLTSRSLLGHLLHCDSLMVFIDGQTKLSFQRVVLLILERKPKCLYVE